MSMTGIILIILLVLIVVIFLIGNLLYNLALNPKGDKSKVFGNAGFVFEADRADDIFKRVKPEDVYTMSGDGLKLHALMVKQPEDAPSDKWVIGVHGYLGNAREMGWRNAEFYNHGYNCLFPNDRGHDKSEGNYIGMGWDDRLDLLKWMDYINENYPGSTIIMFGISMGGGAVMMTAGEKLPDNLKLIIEDCGYSSIKDEFIFEGKSMFHIPYFPLVAAANLICKIRAGYFFGDGSSVRQLAKAKVPMLFIHGDSDVFVPSAMLDVVYDAAACPKEKLVIKGAGHAKAMDTDPQLYWKTIFDFIDRWS